MARESSIFFKIERKNFQLGILKIVAKKDEGDARLYASEIFEYPNYANNGLRHSSMVGETCYLFVEDEKAKLIFLSVEASKRTSFQIHVKFVKQVDSLKKAAAAAETAHNNTQPSEKELLAAIRRDSASGNLFKAFMSGKLDEQARQEVLTTAKQVRAEKHKRHESLKRRVFSELEES